MLQYLRFLKRGWVLIALGIVTILLVGVFNPVENPMDLAFRYWYFYLSAISLIAVGIILTLEP